MLEERVGAGGRQPVDVALGRVEQRHDGVEVAVGAGAALAAAERQAVPAVGDVEGVPHRPEDRLRTHPRRPRAGPVVAVHRARHVEPRVDGVREATYRRGVVTERRGVPGFEQDRGQQLVAGALPAAVELLAPQQPTQPPEPDRVTLAQRRQHEVDGALGFDAVLRVQRDLEHGVDERQQRTDGHLVADRALAGRRQHRHAVGHEDPAQRLVAALAAHDDGHLAPRDAVEQVGRSQPGRDVGRLLRRRPQQGDLDVATRVDRLR